MLLSIEVKENTHILFFFSVHRESLLPFFTAFLTIRYLIIKLRVVCSTVLLVLLVLLLMFLKRIQHVF